MCQIKQYITFTETTWNTAENRREEVAKWTLATHPGANYIHFSAGDRRHEARRQDQKDRKSKTGRRIYI
jgi:hypothetical protein